MPIYILWAILKMSFSVRLNAWYIVRATTENIYLPKNLWTSDGHVLVLYNITPNPYLACLLKRCIKCTSAWVPWVPKCPLSTRVSKWLSAKVAIEFPSASNAWVLKWPLSVGRALFVGPSILWVLFKCPDIIIKRVLKTFFQGFTKFYYCSCRIIQSPGATIV